MKQKLHLIIDEKCYRDILRYALLTKEEICVTDAHALVVHKTSVIFPEVFVASIPDGRWLIPKDVLKKMNTKGAEYMFVGENIEIDIKGSKTLHPIKREDIVSTGMFPDYKRVIPKTYDGKLNAVALQPEFLDNIRQALDPDMDIVYLYFSDGAHAMNVRVPETSYVKDYIAILMPALIQ